jgi:hypothetical protein
MIRGIGGVTPSTYSENLNVYAARVAWILPQNESSDWEIFCKQFHVKSNSTCSASPSQAPAEFKDHGVKFPLGQEGTPRHVPLRRSEII